MRPALRKGYLMPKKRFLKGALKGVLEECLIKWLGPKRWCLTFFSIHSPNLGCNICSFIAWLNRSELKSSWRVTKKLELYKEWWLATQMIDQRISILYFLNSVPSVKYIRKYLISKLILQKSFKNHSGIKWHGKDFSIFKIEKLFSLAEGM